MRDWKCRTEDDCTATSDEYQMWSPNSDDVGHSFVCAWDDDCTSQGDEWWGPSRTPGGPAPYTFDDKWQ